MHDVVDVPQAARGKQFCPASPKAAGGASVQLAARAGPSPGAVQAEGQPETPQRRAADGGAWRPQHHYNTRAASMVAGHAYAASPAAPATGAPPAWEPPQESLADNTRAMLAVRLVVSLVVLVLIVLPVLVIAR